MASENEEFAAWLRERARAAGYEIDGPRSGGKAKLAEDSGVSRGQVGRALAGDVIPDITSQRRLARALGVPLPEMMIRAEVAGPEDFPSETTAGSGPITLERAAELLGVTTKHGRQLFAAMAQAILEHARAVEEYTRDDVEFARWRREQNRRDS